VLQIASPKDLYAQPTSVEVADFIGQMNFMDATVLEAKDGKVLLDAAGLGRVTARSNKSFIQNGRPVVVAIRPEQFRVLDSAPEGRPSVKGKMKTASYLGDRSHIYVEVANHERPMAVSAQEGLLPGGTERGGEIYLSWPEEAVLVLPPA